MQHSVVIAGGGPTGLMLAAELALAGINVVVVERSTGQEIPRVRAGGLHSRSIEVLDQRGIANRFLSEGQTYGAVYFHHIHPPLDISDFPTRHNYLLGLWQNHIERILAGWVAELAVPVLRGRAVTGFVQDANGIDVTLSDGQTLRAEYLVGCDGGRSTIRKAAGIEFPGWDPTMSWLIAELAVRDEPKLGFHQDAVGLHAIGKADDPGLVRVVLTERQVSSNGGPTLQDFTEALKATYGTDFGAHSPRWVSRFTDMTRQAANYRDRRVLLAGDAAHIHPPIGGQGLNLGLQDAVNLGWKLAQVVKRISPETLLDTYQAERHPVAARALQNTMAAVALRRTDDRTKALEKVVCELFVLDEPRRRLAGMMSGLDIHYDMRSGASYAASERRPGQPAPDTGSASPQRDSHATDTGATHGLRERQRFDAGEPHPLLGRRMPDLELVVSAGDPVRAFSLLHGARPVLINLGEPGRIAISPWADRVRVIDAKYTGAWELPVLGAVDAPKAVLIRPDGYVAWVGDPAQVGLTDALTTWFGSATAA
jgi:3-(3-hydroxy-phenyl)propionate hydroxylase